MRWSLRDVKGAGNALSKNILRLIDSNIEITS